MEGANVMTHNDCCFELDNADDYEDVASILIAYLSHENEKLAHYASGILDDIRYNRDGHSAKTARLDWRELE